MDFQYFFWHKTDFAAAGLEKGFQLYSAGHILWILAIAAGCWLMSGIYKKSDTKRRRKIRRFFAVALALSEIYKDGVLWITGNFNAEYLPFHLCGLAIFAILIDAFMENQQITGELIAYAFMPGAVCALLFCNWTEYPFLNFMNLHSFLFHGWIVCYMAMRYRGGEIRPSLKGLWQTAAFVAAAAPVLFLFNRSQGTNFMFLNEASEGSPLVALWDLFGEKYGYPGYLTAYGVLAIAVFHALWLGYSLLEKGFNKR